MNINKAVKMEKKHLKLFIAVMVLIAVTLPLALFVTNLFTIFYLIFLLIIELLICAAIIVRLNAYKIKFRCVNNRLIFSMGILAKEYLILCDKVAIVHTNNCDYDLEILLITSMNFKNKALRQVDNGIFKKYPDIKKYYLKLQEKDKDKKHYFQVIKRGGLKKYLLLDSIYKNCVKAVYTNESIQNIKIARGQMID